MKVPAYLDKNVMCIIWDARDIKRIAGPYHQGLFTARVEGPVSAAGGSLADMAGPIAFLIIFVS